MNRWKRWMGWFSLLFVMGALSGCMYPQEKKEQLDKLGEQIAQVQSAVDTYYKTHHVLPYRYTDQDYKLTTKYKVDFKELQGDLGWIPPSAYEQGGDFLYVLVNVEKKPTVRLFDLRVNDKVEQVQPYVREYYSKHKKWPIGAQVAPHFFELDYEKLGIDPVTIPSPYSKAELPLILDDRGLVYVDYRTEAMKKWQTAKVKPTEDEDLRLWLAEDSFFVPAFSPVMKMKNSEPVLMEENQ